MKENTISKAANFSLCFFKINLIYRGSADLYKDLFALPYGEREAKYKEEDLLQNITAFTDSALSLWVMIIRYIPLIFLHCRAKILKQDK